MSKNNKPANNPADKEKQPQTSPASTNPSANNSSAKGSDERKPAMGGNAASAPGNDKASAATSNPSQHDAASQTTKNSKPTQGNADQVKANDTPAKPIPSSSKPLNATKPGTVNSSSPAKESSSKNTDSTKDASSPVAGKPASSSGNTGYKGNGNSTPPPTDNHSAKQSPLPLILSLIALGVGGYALYNSTQQPQHNSEDLQKLQAQVAEFEKQLNSETESTEIADLQKNVQSLAQQISDIKSQPVTESGLNESQIQALVSEQVDQAKQALQESLSAQQSQPATQTGLSKDQVSTMIKDALASIGESEGSNQPKIDFSTEIETIKQDKADIEQYLQQIKQQGESIKSSLQETAEQAKSNLNQSVSEVEQKITAADQQPVVYPLINALTLAEVAGNARQYGVASQYLQQAKSSFADLHLDQPPYAEFAGQIDELAQKTAELAKQNNSQREIDSIITSVNNWSFISTDPENMLDNKPDHTKPTESWKDDIKQIGSNILSSTVTITKNDAAGLTWVNENPHLQQIIRENVRLDLAMVRNALLIGDQERAQQIASTLREEVGRYFNTESAEVKQAMNKLDELTQQHSDAPDIATLIKSIRQAG